MDSNIVISIIGSLTTIITAIITTSRKQENQDNNSSKPNRFLSLLFLVVFVGFVGLLIYTIVSSLNCCEQIVLPVQNAEYLFDDINDWQVLKDNPSGESVPISRDKIDIEAGALDRGISLSLTVEPDQPVTYIVQYKKRLDAIDVITADVYVPDDDNIQAHWTAIQVIDQIANVDGRAFNGTSIDKGEWNRLMLDLRKQYDSNNIPLNQGERNLTVEIVFELTGDATSSDIIVGLDNVIAYSNVGNLTQFEQSGQKTTVFNFETDPISWTTMLDRDAIDTVSREGFDIPYRGLGVLEVNTQIVDVTTAMGAKVTIPVEDARGIWVAHVYVPDVPDIEFWSNLFTYEGDNQDFSGEADGEGDSNTVRLVKGEWNTLIRDTRQVDWVTDEIVFGIQVGTINGEFIGSIYIDDVYIFSE